MNSRGTAFIAGISFALGLAIWERSGPVAAAPSGNPSELPQIIFVQAPAVRMSSDLAKRFPRGSRLERLDPGNPGAAPSNLTPEFHAAADPALSSEGTRVLFSGRVRADVPWQIWEMDTDGSHKQQITHCSSDCLRPAYLPENLIVYSGMEGNGAWRDSTLYVCRRDGSNPHPITFGPGNFQVETVLRSGRLLISGLSSLVTGSPGQLPRALYTLRPDGTGLTSFRSNRYQALIPSGARELDDGTVLFVAKNVPAISGPGGALVSIRRGALHNSRISPREFSYWSAHELGREKLVVARAGPSSPGTDAKFDLYTFDLASGSDGKLIYRDPEFSSVQAIPLVPRPEPKTYWSILHPQMKTGRVICLNAYLTAEAAQGRLTKAIARVRVLLLGPDGRREQVLGEAPVETDGSFYVSVAADRPIRFELLGAKGQVIQAQRSWVWTRPGEDMGCLGCHDDKATAPPNHWPMALTRFDTPIALGVHNLPARAGQ